MTAHLPHAPYITAVSAALAAAGLEPADCWVEDADLDYYRDDDLAGLATMLTAVLVWDDEHPALNTEAHRHGITLAWEHPAEQWQWGARTANGHLERDPEFLPALGRYAHPEAIVATVRALLAGQPTPTGPAPEWPEAAATRAEVAAWAAAEESTR